MQIFDMKNYKHKTILEKFKNALNGLKVVFLQELNLRIHIFSAIFVLTLLFVFPLNGLEKLIIITCICGIIFLEIINTLIEEVCDLYSLEYNEKIKKIKDISAGMVLFGVAIVLCAGAWVFVPYVFGLVNFLN